MHKLVCPRCNGKGSALMKDTKMKIACPSCGGTGYLKEDFLDENNNDNKIETNPITIKTEIKQQEINKDLQIIILQQIIKNPDLFLEGIKLLFKDQNQELFIYLQNQNIFEVENKEDGMQIKLRPEFKNSLAKQCIEYLTTKRKHKKCIQK